MLSDIPCVTPPVLTYTTIGTAISTNIISLGEGSCVTHTMIDYSCTSMIKTVTVMSSCVLTEQVSSRVHTG